jgi:hypothetical protein
VLVTRLSVKDGRLVLPDGMSYRVLVLPDNPSLTPEALQKVAALVKAGATVVGSRPTRSPSLKGYPVCDQQVEDLADKVWGPPPEGEQAAASEHAYGKGRVIWGKKVAEVLSSQGVMPDFACAGADLDYIHRSTADSDIYFVSNKLRKCGEGILHFRVSGRQLKLWDPLDGRIRDAVAFTQRADHRSTVPLELGPRGSLFVVFRKPIAVAKNGAKTGNFAAYSQVMELEGAWRFA